MDNICIFILKDKKDRKMQLKKSLIALALTSTLAACGSDSSTQEPVTQQIPVVSLETIVNGKAIKGVLTNAVVTVYKFVDGSPVTLTDTELKDANVSTDGEGNYNFTVLDYNGPIKIQLSPSKDPANPTTMICDAPAGCGETAYGKKIDLTAIDPDFSLDAISIVDSSSNGEVKVNVSALTHLAASLIEASDAGITADSITENSTKIASTFGIKGDITKLEPTVTDNTSAIAAEDNEAELRYGLINAGIMSALFSGETSSSGVLSSKLAEVAADLVTNKGAFLVTQDEDSGFELALAEVLEGASVVAKVTATAINADESLTSTLNLAQLETQLVNEQAYQEANVGEDGFANVVVDVLTAGDAVAKAKAMVEDVRLFSHLFNDETTDGAGIKTQGDEYVALLDNAGVMIESEIENFELLAQISNALADLSLQYDTGTLTPEASALGVPIASYLTAAGASGTITFEERTATDGIIFKVSAEAGTEKATLNASAEFSEDNKSITLTIDGLLESAGAKFTLNEGSFAKVNLDTPASRDTLENDTYEGKAVSGELELALSLAQKATDAVPNPITFEGMVKTKLLPVKERRLDERWDWDQQQQQSVISYGRNRLETVVLPEILSLSGAFSSLEGDLVKATLTVNINDLADYQAPEFKYIGKEVADVLNITFSDDLNTVVLTEADKTVDDEQVVETRIFTPGTQLGEWTATNSTVANVPEKHYWGTGIERKIITKRFDSGLSEKGVFYTRAYIIGDEENSYGAKSIRITPVDHDANGTTDAYNIQRLYLSNNIKGTSYGTTFDSIMDANGNLLTSEGDILSWDNASNLGEYPSIDEFIKNNSNHLVANPLTVSNSAQLFAQSLTNRMDNKYRVNVDDLGTVTVFFNEEELTDIAAGEFTELNPTAYLTQPLIKDVLTVKVSEDANTVSYSIENGLSRKFTFSGVGNGNFTAEIATTDLEAGEEHHTATKTIVSSTTDIGLNVDEVRLNITESHTAHPTDPNSGSHQIIITPQDNDGDADADQFIARHGYGNHFNANGKLVDEANEVIVFDNSIYEIFNSYDEVHWNEPNFANDVPFNPLTADNALNLFKDIIANESNSPYVWVDDIGRLEVNLNDGDLDSIIANSTTMFDAMNTETDSDRLLENENTFLDINAALTLEAILGDYQVKLQLSGDRTALEGGAFDLDMSYRLPGADTQRSFTAHYNTEVEGHLTANNADGVVLVLNEADEDATGTQVIGQILVGPTAIVAATIEDRDGLIVIVYSDETTESL